MNIPGASRPTQGTHRAGDWGDLSEALDHVLAQRVSSFLSACYVQQSSSGGLLVIHFQVTPGSKIALFWLAAVGRIPIWSCTEVTGACLSLIFQAVLLQGLKSMSTFT